MFGFMTKKHSLLGIDISTTAIKLLELGRTGNQIQVEHYSVVPFKSNAVVEKKIQDELSVATTLKEVVENAKTKTKHASVAVAGSAVITKTIEMDVGLEENDMENQIILEADQYIPFPLEDVAIDFQVQGVGKDSHHVSVLLAACRRENIERLEDVLKQGGLKADVIDVEAYAMERACSLLHDQDADFKKDTIAVVDIGATMATMTVLKQGEIIYTREQLFGGRQLTERVQQEYGLSYDEAGKAKKTGDLPDFEQRVLTPFKQAIEQHIAKALQLFYSATSVNQIDALILAGGTSLISGLKDYLSEALNIPTSLANPFQDMVIAKSVDEKRLINEAPALMIACGLAMRRFDQ